jgi:hypothetical protein
MLREEMVMVKDVHEGCGLQRVGQVPACSRSRLGGFGLW